MAITTAGLPYSRASRPATIPITPGCQPSPATTRAAASGSGSSRRAASAAEIGVELGRANLDRRQVEREVQTAAEAARRELPDPDAAALVVAGEGWHPGVIGIVAG
ncbi:MAG: hypothetical protein ACSLFD_10145, partial [Solirubrobacterales bacterium]